MKKETIYKVTAVLLLGLPLIALGATGLITITTTAAGIMNGIGKVLGSIAVVVGIGFIVIGTFKFATSGGDPRTLDEAKISIIWGVVALLIGIGLMNTTGILAIFGITIV